MMEMRSSIAQKAWRVVLAATLAFGSVLVTEDIARAETEGPGTTETLTEAGEPTSADGGEQSSGEGSEQFSGEGGESTFADAPEPDSAEVDDPASTEEGESDDESTSDDALYEQYLSDRTPTGSSVGWGELYRDKSYDGSPLSLLVDGQEQTFEHGFWAHADSSIYFNDIQEYGYERFEAMVGLSHTARVAGKSAEVVFKVVADGEVMWQSEPLTEWSDAVPVSLDISGCKVVQLVAEASNKPAHPNNHAVWADAKFTKQEATPWLSVSAKEFSNPEQVTSANILEGAFARTLSGPVGETDGPVTGSDGTLHNGKEGNDLSDVITYTTDYVEGQTGSFSITYSVQDAQGLVRSRTVGMTVRSDEVYRTDADLDYLTTPFASFLYTGRDYFDEQGKAAFDLSVETLLNFGNDVDSYELAYYWGEAWKVTINLQERGIYMSTSDAGYLCSTIMDCEPRTFHVKDWGTQVTSKGGIADTVTFYVAPKYGEKDESGQVYYHTRLLQTEVNASRFLSNVQDGMTDSQRLRAVLSPYASWLSYGGGGQVMDEALAGGLAVCGGNARGSIYLSQRMGIKAYWVRTDSHAWSNVKLNHDDSGVSGESGRYYRIDLLAGTSCFLSVDAEHQGFHGHHKEIYFNRMKGYPDMVTANYPYAWTGWPSVALDVEDSWVVLAPEDAATFDASKLVISASSIYDGDLKDSVSVDCGDLRANDEGVFEDGYYPIVYTVSDTHGNSATATVNVQVVGGDVVRANAENCAQNVNSTFLPDAGGSLPSLWNGSGEAVYSYGIAQNDGGKSVTYAVDRGNGVRLTCLDAWVGLHRSTRDSQWGYNGKVRFIVKALVSAADGGTEEKVLYTSADMTRYTVQEHVLVKIPDDAISVTLTSESLGSGNGHARWGNPRFFTAAILDEVPVAPVISGVEDGAVYSTAVTPSVIGASEVALYRKNIPVVVDSDTGVPIEAASDVSASDDSARSLPTSSDWGEKVEGYRAGDAIVDEGVYTLVAVNGYNQRAMVSFTIGKADTPEEPTIVFPSMTVGEAGPYAVSATGPAGASFSYEVEDSSVLAISADGSITPKAAGSTVVSVTMTVDGVVYGPFSHTVVVSPRRIVVTVDDAQVYTGAALPQFGYSLEGSLLPGDSLGEVSYSVVDAEGAPAGTDEPGVRRVVAQFAELGANYTVESIPGTLTVLQEGVDPAALGEWVAVESDGAEVADGAWARGPVSIVPKGKAGAAGMYDVAVREALSIDARSRDAGSSVVVSSEGEVVNSLRLKVSSGQGGNAGAFTSVFDVVTRVDNTAPTVVLESSSAARASDGPVTVVANAQDVVPEGVNKVSGVAEVRFEVVSETGEVVLSETKDASSASVDLSEPGKYTVSAVALDAAGNESAPASLSLEVKDGSDGEAPEGGSNGAGGEEGDGGASGGDVPDGSVPGEGDASDDDNVPGAGGDEGSSGDGVTDGTGSGDDAAGDSGAAGDGDLGSGPSGGSGDADDPSDGAPDSGDAGNSSDGGLEDGAAGDDAGDDAASDPSDDDGGSGNGALGEDSGAGTDGEGAGDDATGGSESAPSGDAGGQTDGGSGSEGDTSDGLGSSSADKAARSSDRAADGHVALVSTGDILALASLFVIVAGLVACAYIVRSLLVY